ncbi:hypothetical protein [Capnocytophaga canis]|uniref:Uncharacterized protein n=1 Tax=Capnocytophaga canis TaxID=1848903 RepID=A0A0B7IWT0_9FLAO|nr:hypothetical protein [Capnocytophaga canis]GIM60527.1 hypothetical protein CAPN008_05770 [Capnocytophaga canis]CEN54438.1 hypothetical protein CCAND93_90022 [Capnocytophaga canis]
MEENIFGKIATERRFLFDIFYNVEPLSAYLMKTNTYMIGLYYQNRLIGGFLEETTETPITYTQMGMALDNVMPKNLSDLGKYVKKNKGVVEYYFLSAKHMEMLSCPIKKSMTKNK